MEGSVTISVELALNIMSSLRLAHIYALKDSFPDELGPDFKPWKWENEKKYADEASALAQALFDEIRPQVPSTV